MCVKSAVKRSLRTYTLGLHLKSVLAVSGLLVGGKQQNVNGDLESGGGLKNEHQADYEKLPKDEHQADLVQLRRVTK